MRGVPGQLLQGGDDDLLDLVQQDRRRPAGARLVVPARPAGPRTNRPRHRATVVLGDPQLARRPALLFAPSAQASTIRARSASDLGGLRPPRPPAPAGPARHPSGPARPSACPARGPSASPPGPELSEPLAPLPHRARGKPEISGHPGVAPAAGSAQASTIRARSATRARPGPQQPPELRPVLIRQRQRRSRKRHDNSLRTYVDNFRRRTLVSPA